MSASWVEVSRLQACSIAVSLDAVCDGAFRYGAQVKVIYWGVCATETLERYHGYPLVNSVEGQYKIQNQST